MIAKMQATKERSFYVQGCVKIQRRVLTSLLKTDGNVDAAMVRVFGRDRLYLKNLRQHVVRKRTQPHIFLSTLRLAVENRWGEESNARLLSPANN